VDRNEREHDQRGRCDEHRPCDQNSQGLVEPLVGRDVDRPPEPGGHQQNSGGDRHREPWPRSDALEDTHAPKVPIATAGRFRSSAATSATSGPARPLIARLREMRFITETPAHPQVRRDRRWMRGCSQRREDRPVSRRLGGVPILCLSTAWPGRPRSYTLASSSPTEPEVKSRDRPPGADTDWAPGESASPDRYDLTRS